MVARVGLWQQASLSTSAKPGKAAAVSRVRGTRDLLAEEAEQQQRVVQILQQTVQRYGFRPVRILLHCTSMWQACID